MTAKSSDDDQVYIVFRGLPEVIPGDVRDAEEYAAEKALGTQEDWTVLRIDRESLKGLVARYTGVVMRSLEEVMKL